MCIRDSHYTVAVGDVSYVLAPALTHPKTALFTLGYSAAFQKNSVLYAQLPGTTLKVRVVKDKVYVRIGDRESPYHVVSLASATPEKGGPTHQPEHVAAAPSAPVSSPVVAPTPAPVAPAHQQQNSDNLGP